MNALGTLSFFASILVLLVAVSGAKEKVYKVGRAFPMRSLEYVKKRFKEINPTLVSAMSIDNLILCINSLDS